MQTLIFAYSLLAALLAPASWPLPAEALPTHQLDSSVIEGSNLYLKAVIAGDVAAIVSMYRDDAVLMAPGGAPFHGKAAIEQFYRGFCGGPAKVTAFTFDHIEATVVGDTAYDVGSYRMTMTFAPGKAADDRGKYTAILKRAGAEWKLAYLIFNSDLPPHPGQQK